MGRCRDVSDRVCREGIVLRLQVPFQQLYQQPSSGWFHHRSVNLVHLLLLQLIPFASAVPAGEQGLNTPAGALGLGSVDASALTNLFTFLAYVIPIFGGIVSDTRWGRFKTICVGASGIFYG